MSSIGSRQPQDTLEWLTSGQREEMRLLGLAPCVVGYDEHGNLVRAFRTGALRSFMVQVRAANS